MIWTPKLYWFNYISWNTLERFLVNTTRWFSAIKAQLQNTPLLGAKTLNEDKLTNNLISYPTAGAGKPPWRVSGMPRSTRIACYFLSLKTFILKPRDIAMARLLGWKGKGGGGNKPQTNMLPCVSLTSAGSSRAHSTSTDAGVPVLRGPRAAAFPGKSAFSTHRSPPRFACSQPAILDCVLSSPENLEPFSLLSH